MFVVVFKWDDLHGPCDDCGHPAAFKDVGGTDLIWCSVCAANHAADGDAIARIEES